MLVERVGLSVPTKGRCGGLQTLCERSQAGVAQFGRSMVGDAADAGDAEFPGGRPRPFLDPRAEPTASGHDLVLMDDQRAVEIDPPQFLGEPVGQVLDPAGVDTVPARHHIPSHIPGPGPDIGPDIDPRLNPASRRRPPGIAGERACPRRTEELVVAHRHVSRTRSTATASLSASPAGTATVAAAVNAANDRRTRSL